ncbi:UNVERIFIED_CONTAM: hypothetical protein Cloal_0439 [Acetivibrio alkalicellulosi]
MKNLAFLNLIFAVLFAIMLRLSAFCILTHYNTGERTTEMKMYGIQIGDFSVSWRVVLVIIILLFIAYLVCLFKLLITSVKLKHLALKLSKNQKLLIILSLVIVISSVIIAACEREEYGSIRIRPDKSLTPIKHPLQPVYISLTVDNNKGFLFLEKDDEAIRMKASSKAIDAVNTILDSEDIVLVMISYRKNILFSQEYKISGIRNQDGRTIVFYVSHLKRHDDFFPIDLASTGRDYID